MFRRLIQSLRLRFGLRARTCAKRNRPLYSKGAPFAVVMRDGLPMIEPRVRR